MPLHPRHYRLRFLLDLSSTILIPQLCLFVTLAMIKYEYTSISASVRVLLHFLVIPFVGLLRVCWDEYNNTRAAISLNAVPIPCVRGKWPGNLDVAVKLVRSLHDDYLMQFYAKLFDEYGVDTLNTRILWGNQIITIDHELVKHLLTGAGAEKFHKGYYWQERFEAFLGNGIFNRDKEEWRVHRQIARPWFARERISDFNIFAKHTDRTLEIISSLITKGGSTTRAFDAQDLFARFTLDTASEFLFGKSLDTLQAELPGQGRHAIKMGPKGSAIDDEFGSFAWAFEDVQIKISTRMRVGNIWPMFELFQDKTEKSNAVVHDFLRPLVDQALEKKHMEDNKVGDENETFLDHLAQSTDDHDTVRFQLLNMLLAGRDTTSTLLTFVIYFLCCHPEVTTGLRAEIFNQYGHEGRPTLESLKSLKYLRAVLNETLRLFPPVPMNSRLSESSPCSVPTNNGHSIMIPPGTTILYNTFLIQRRKDLWGDDADVFRPERWLRRNLNDTNVDIAVDADVLESSNIQGSDGDGLRKFINDPFIFLPFHAGPRVCLGQNFALNEASYFLVLLLQRFKSFELAEDSMPEGSSPPLYWKERTSGRQRYERIWPKSSVTTFVKGGLWVRAIPT
ncbi:cytochrome P450 [Lentinula aciculospora]|uniref:Cytochrome P450 n=1 Tax=Lentinula aciculospora TaxID=153920 RepID=A0A9W9DND4_9AGAR|nr:cytochrome P450 [Lentinula aciculospora]